jgi:transposase
MESELTVTVERVDDFVLLIQVMMRLSLPAILDRHIPRHWLQEGLSWGWVATIWLAHIVSQGDHRSHWASDLLWVGDWVAPPLAPWQKYQVYLPLILRSNPAP